ncbi:hypothetical protein COV53_02270 [Candidatus Gottesmanbacteria bacterium CG11_big_fil_rev_8_21_14_0_20_37_11]|uniref:Uncharacterized protein n=1 Tax=Candidatus Gottesmanbacteria bacterium CG11_big_fil_rev_8_21_14_0_20_37_11 TaxID=1974575 RepID=A0A2H0NK20_9BACT|nr:MAG: hypothetical protein COV53_02270 [Candidatus Gottesmanbacteria bacterium CG11_big_fil_rev_8_21_14_0_20_37_11]
MDDQTKTDFPSENKTAQESTNKDTTNQADVIISLEQLIKGHASNIDRLKVELKKYKEMLDDIFTNDSVYKDHLEKVKEATKIKTATKQQILKRPDVSDLANKIKDMKISVKELEGALSEYLREYQRMTGTNQIEGENGEIMEIVYVAKLVKKSARYQS